MDPLGCGLVDAPVAGRGGAQVGLVDSDAHVGSGGIEGLQLGDLRGGWVVDDDVKHETAGFGRLEVEGGAQVGNDDSEGRDDDVKGEEALVGLDIVGAEPGFYGCCCDVQGFEGPVFQRGIEGL